MRKGGAVREIPPPLELLCLRALWSLEEANVSQVREAVAQSRSLAYTTVMTLLDRLMRRGLITRTKSGRAYFYQPSISRDTMRRLALQEFLEAYFESSPDQLVQFLQAPRPGNQRASHSLDAALL